MFNIYYTLAKPGIVYGNIITVVAGFFLAVTSVIDWELFVFTLFGISLVMASGCVFNNILDRDIDALMERTRNRAFSQGLISVRGAVLYGLMLGITGTLVLYFFVNTRATIMALLGFFAYVVLYTMWSKRSSVHGTLIGSISGAIPPVVGYVAVTNTFDLGVFLLFLMLCFWQMPHSYSIALYRLEDYARVDIPVLPVKKGIFITKVHILLYSMLFSITALLLAEFGYAGDWYAGATFVLCILFLALGSKGFAAPDHKEWARTMYLFSVVLLTFLCVMIVVEKLVVYWTP